MKTTEIVSRTQKALIFVAVLCGAILLSVEDQNVEAPEIDNKLPLVDNTSYLTNKSSHQKSAELSLEAEEQVEEIVEEDFLGSCGFAWTNEELDAMARTLAGECYEDKESDKRLVCEVILNRVSADGFGDTIEEVLTASGQFDGYCLQARPVTENDYAVAVSTLNDWQENDRQALSDYLYFSAGRNRENTFRKNY